MWMCVCVCMYARLRICLGMNQSISSWTWCVHVYSLLRIESECRRMIRSSHFGLIVLRATLISSLQIRLTYEMKWNEKKTERSIRDLADKIVVHKSFDKSDIHTMMGTSDWTSSMFDHHFKPQNGTTVRGQRQQRSRRPQSDTTRCILEYDHHYIDDGWLS